MVDGIRRVQKKIKLDETVTLNAVAFPRMPYAVADGSPKSYMYTSTTKLLLCWDIEHRAGTNSLCRRRVALLHGC